MLDATERSAMPDSIRQTPSIDNSDTTTTAMKSPLKPAPALITSPLKQANSLGSGSFLQQDEEFDAVVGGAHRRNPFKKKKSAATKKTADPFASLLLAAQQQPGRGRSKQQQQDENSPYYAARVEEWYSFAAFDPIVDSFTITSSSSSSAAATAARSLHSSNINNSSSSNNNNSNTTTSKKRVQWKLDENGEVECQEHEPTITDYDLIRSQWYDAPSFRRFRLACHEMSLKASLDPDYTSTFRHHLSLCRRGAPPVLEEDDVLEFAPYRGLERAVFRQELQSAKFSAIQNTVAQQEDPFANSVDALGETARQWTATARHMARALARQDELIAQDACKNDNGDDDDDDESGSGRRFIEI